uniref:Uncharacterized protein n=1 Tax=Erpetoichthys calabaricus TaxID=27687 RepID=A0A8C4T745_ERPCA
MPCASTPTGATTASARPATGTTTRRSRSLILNLSVEVRETRSTRRPPAWHLCALPLTHLSLSDFTSPPFPFLLPSDINECTEQRGLCGPNATCKNTIGNYSCSCQPGFRSTSGQQTFTANESSCQGNASLINASYRHAFCMTPAGPVTIGFSSYTGMELILNESFFNSSVSTSSAMKVNSPVVTATVSSRRQHNVTGPVKLTFHHKQLHWSNSVFCVYWKYQKYGSSWSPEGCEVVISNVSHTTCSCSHLTSFALIMAVNEQKIPDDSAFSIFSCVVVSTSLVCLALAILTFLFTRSIVDANKTVYLHLSLCLFGAHLLFLIGVEWTSNKTLCSVVAGLLHFLFLASFTWMSLGGLQLLLLVRNLRAVKYSSRKGLRRRHLLPVGYGAPALIVAVAAVVFSRGYGGERHCWLSHQRGFFWSFLGPSCPNPNLTPPYFSEVKDFRGLLWQLHVLSSLPFSVFFRRQLTFKSIAHFVIMGCSWAVGLHQELQVLRYLFVLLNGLQGFFIFLVYCLLNRQVNAGVRLSVCLIISVQELLQPCHPTDGDVGAGGDRNGESRR